ncbi:MAG TPA: hypothetical protein PLJ42_05535 [Chitinophagales bacterium]|jgi:hypothetical protein|nr:hypothetical protein [Chitinophagales bacterium]MBP6153306.1 hypothetical protein [Chitinophagales bacterium]HQV78434.1 hypothetical protein [Chitinophagales bacterium]HQW78880.1 hypothetical protein [Chitinophagales bacterium]HRB18881.1 hypothetical protein [Chitinophagales bacterium]
MKFISTILLVVILSIQVHATVLFNKDDVKLNHTITKYQTVYVPSLKHNIVIWKSTFELENNSKKSIAIRIPCYLNFAYSYLNPAEIQQVQKLVNDIEISDAYKNYISEKPQMLNAKNKILSEKFFATFDNVDLRSATMDWKFKFSFWY